LNTFQTLNTILDQTASVTINKISLNQNVQITSNSMQINYQNLGSNTSAYSIQMTKGQIQVPDLCTATNSTGSACSSLSLTSQAFYMKSTYPGSNTNNIVLNGSQTLSLNFYSSDGSKLNISNSSSPFIFSIPVSQAISSFSNFNGISSKNNILSLDGLTISKKNVSIQYHIKPSNLTKGYFAAIRYGKYPVLNSQSNLSDVSSIFCPKGNFFLINIVLRVPYFWLIEIF